MAITYVATGTRSKVGSGSMSPGMPTGWAADDILICQAVTENNATLSIASGWTLVDSIVSTSGQNTRAAWWWRRAVAGDTAPSITGATGGAMSCIHAFRGCTTSGTPYRTGGGYSSNAPAASLTLTAATITPGSVDDMVVWLGCIEAEFNTTSVSGYSGTNPTFTEGVDDTNSSGANYTGLCMAYGLSGNGAATGSRTATIATPTTAHHISYLIALIPAGAGTQSYSYSASGGLTLGGAATEVRVRSKSAAGGAQLGGTSAQARVRASTAAGGLTLGGASAFATGQTVSPAGGLALAGSASQIRVRAPASAGGVVLGGTAGYSSSGTQTYSYSASGGVQLAGSGSQARATVRAPSGGLSLGGSASMSIHEAVRTASASGGLTLRGSAAMTTITAGGAGDNLPIRRRRLSR